MPTFLLPIKYYYENGEFTGLTILPDLTFFDSAKTLDELFETMKATFKEHIEDDGIPPEVEEIANEVKAGETITWLEIQY